MSERPDDLLEGAGVAAGAGAGAGAGNGTAAGKDDELAAHDAVRQALAAERETLSRQCRLNPRRLDAFLADDFLEFGSSGVVLTKQGIAQDVAVATASADYEIGVTELKGHVIGYESGDPVVLVTYVTTFADRSALRSSLWRRTPNGWKMFFHQGTPIPKDVGVRNS